MSIKVTRLVLVTLFSMSIYTIHSQILQGIVVEAKSNNSLAYANIGVLNKNFGTISKENGEFSIDLERIPKKDTLYFSMMGYEPKAFMISELKKGYLKIRLNPNPIKLNEVTVTYKTGKAKIEKLGRIKPSKTTTGHGGSGEFGWGGEWGLMIYNQSKTYQINDVNFHLRFNTVDSVLFRLHIYNISDGLPYESILTQDVFTMARKKDKWVTYDLTNENIVIEEDIIVTSELVRIWYSDIGENHLFFTHGKDYEKGGSYSRDSSFDQWKMDERPPITLYLNAKILNEEKY